MFYVVRVRLSKRRKAGGGQVAKSRLLIKHRDLNEKEIGAQVSLRFSYWAWGNLLRSRMSYLLVKKYLVFYFDNN